MKLVRRNIFGLLVSRLSRLRYPTLFMLAAGLFVADILLPDPLPFADEIMLGLLTAIAWSLGRRQGDDA